MCIDSYVHSLGRCSATGDIGTYSWEAPAQTAGSDWVSTCRSGSVDERVFRAESPRERLLRSGLEPKQPSCPHDSPALISTTCTPSRGSSFVLSDRYRRRNLAARTALGVFEERRSILSKDMPNALVRQSTTALKYATFTRGGPQSANAPKCLLGAGGWREGFVAEWSCGWRFRALWSASLAWNFLLDALRCASPLVD